MFDERRRAGNGHGALSPEDRRTFPRYHFTAAAEALDAQHRTRMNARTSDLSKGGCYVDTFSPFPLKTGVKLRITREKASFTAEAKVVYSKIGMGMGLAFTSVDPQEMPVLEKWIGELSGTAPLEMAELSAVKESNHNGAARNSSAKEPGYVLNELILALMRKGTLTEEEGKTMLLRLVHRDFLP
ncbi:MAG: PilZ domain-containing protein [Candidatus Acidiferrum sp.]